MGEFASVKIEKSFLGIKYKHTEQLPHRLREADETIPSLDPDLRIDADLINVGDMLAAHRVIAKIGTTEETPVPGRVVRGEVISMTARQVVLASEEGIDTVLPLCDYLDTELIHPPTGVVLDMEGPDAPLTNGRLPGDAYTCRNAFYLMAEAKNQN